MEIKIQLMIGKKNRQFFEPNSMSPGSLKKPSRPSAIRNNPAMTVKRPIKINNLPSCCEPFSIDVSQNNIRSTDIVNIQKRPAF